MARCIQHSAATVSSRPTAMASVSPRQRSLNFMVKLGVTLALGGSGESYTVSNRDVMRRMLVQAPRPKRRNETHHRLIDICVALPALIFLAPVLLIIGIMIAIQRNGPIIFAHTRIGRNGAPFKVYKFRSMHIDGDKILAAHLAVDGAAREEWRRDHKLKADPRVTPFGDFLRRSSLDELPQLYNVLIGNMSIVGPRPIVEAEIVKYGRFYKGYCSVKPGITGIWQISGRNDVSYRRRVAMDALYARRKCLSLDIKLMSATIPAVLARRGSY